MKREIAAASLLSRVVDGDDSATDYLMPIVYEELRQIAGKLMANGSEDGVLQPTALVHEVYLKLVGSGETTWRDRAHFRAIAARAMRQVLVDHVRGQERVKRGRGWRRVTLSEASRELDPEVAIDFAWLESALDELARRDERAVRVVVLRFFGGLRVNDVAAVLGVSSSTVRDDWRMARAWLRCRLDEP